MVNRLFNNALSFIERLSLQNAWIDLRLYCVTREWRWVFPPIPFLIVLVAMIFLVRDTLSQQKISRDLKCLTQNIYHEARGEPEAGKVAVALVTMNRVRSQRYPNTICEVVFEQRWDAIRRRYVGAFSWTELESKRPLQAKDWQKAWRVAETVYNGRQTLQLDGVLFYHATHIKPSWARTMTPVKKIGHHIFYK